MFVSSIILYLILSTTGFAEDRLAMFYSFQTPASCKVNRPMERYCDALWQTRWRTFAIPRHQLATLLEPGIYCADSDKLPQENVPGIFVYLSEVLGRYCITINVVQGQEANHIWAYLEIPAQYFPFRPRLSPRICATKHLNDMSGAFHSSPSTIVSTRCFKDDSSQGTENHFVFQ